MKQKILLTLATIAVAATCVAGDGMIRWPYTALVVPSDPIASIDKVDRIFHHYTDSDSDVVADLRIEIVTGGIKINWIGQPHTLAVDPTPDAVLEYTVKYHSYCRRPGWNGTEIECVSERGGVIFYQRFDHVWGFSWGRRILVFHEVP